MLKLILCVEIHCVRVPYLDTIGWNTKECGQIVDQVVSKKLVDRHRRQTTTMYKSIIFEYRLVLF